MGRHLPREVDVRVQRDVQCQVCDSEWGPGSGPAVAAREHRHRIDTPRLCRAGEKAGPEGQLEFPESESGKDSAGREKVAGLAGPRADLCPSLTFTFRGVPPGISSAGLRGLARGWCPYGSLGKQQQQ